jgi:hypothetical protein
VEAPPGRRGTADRREKRFESQQELTDRWEEEEIKKIFLDTA